MFTGLIEAVSAVRSAERVGSGLRLVLEPPGTGFEVRSGQSVAVSGACLTHVGESGAGVPLCFDLTHETLERTWFGSLASGRRVNLERALRLGDRLDGHLVSGHVDGLAWVRGSESRGDGGLEIEVEVGAGLERYLIEKGSITLDGVSLTVVAPRARRFRVALIPATLAATTLGIARVGDALHVEADLVGKWLERLSAP